MTTFAFGSPELYEWLDDNEAVAFLPVEVVNSPEVIGANDDMIPINGALAIDIRGQVVADTIAPNQFSGIGGAEDFVAGAGPRAVGPLADLPAADVREGRRPAVADRAVVRARRGGDDAAAPGRRDRHRVRRRRSGRARPCKERGEALAAIAHPQFRDELLGGGRARGEGAALPVE